MEESKRPKVSPGIVVTCYDADGDTGAELNIYDTTADMALSLPATCEIRVTCNEEEFYFTHFAIAGEAETLVIDSKIRFCATNVRVLGLEHIEAGFDQNLGSNLAFFLEEHPRLKAVKIREWTMYPGMDEIVKEIAHAIGEHRRGPLASFTLPKGEEWERYQEAIDHALMIRRLGLDDRVAFYRKRHASVVDALKNDVSKEAFNFLYHLNKDLNTFLLPYYDLRDESKRKRTEDEQLRIIEAAENISCNLQFMLHTPKMPVTIQELIKGRTLARVWDKGEYDKLKLK